MIQANLKHRRRTIPVRVRVPALFAVALVVGSLGLAACGNEAPSTAGFFAKTEDRLVFVEWSQTKDEAAGLDKLEGTATLSLIDRKAFELVNDTASLTGTLSASDVSLTLSKPLDSATSWSGTLSDSLLTVRYTNAEGQPITLTMAEASRATYNTALVTEQKALEEAKSEKTSGALEEKQRAAIDKWGKVVQKDLDQLAEDAAAAAAAAPAATAAADRAEADKDNAKDYMQQAQRHQYGPSICPLADLSSASANAASGEAGAAAAVQTNVEELAAKVRGDITRLTQDHGKLAQAQAELPGYKPKAVPTDKEVNDAIASANETVEDAQHTANGGAKSAASKASLAQGYAADAQTACANAPQEKSSPSPTKK